MKKKTYKDLLLEFNREKDKILFNITGIHLYEDADYKEIEDEWSEEDCKRFFACLNFSCDINCCCWCVKERHCSNCGYGKRHNICFYDYETRRNYNDSTYGKIIELIVEKISYSSFCVIPDIVSLIQYFKGKYEIREKKGIVKK